MVMTPKVNGNKEGIYGWYVLALQRLFFFLAFVSFLSISFFFSFFLLILLLAEVLR